MGKISQFYFLVFQNSKEQYLTGLVPTTRADAIMRDNTKLRACFSTVASVVAICQKQSLLASDDIMQGVQKDVALQISHNVLFP